MVRYGYLTVAGIRQIYDDEADRDKAISGFRDGDVMTFEE